MKKKFTKEKKLETQGSQPVQWSGIIRARLIYSEITSYTYDMANILNLTMPSFHENME